jgi:hypothetical protein
MDYCTKILGSLADLGGKVTRTLSLRDCGNITGKLSDLQGKLTYRLSLGRSTGNWTNVTGDLSDLQSKLTCYLDLSGCVEITGDISSLGNKITDVVNLASCSKITGNIASLSNVGTTLNLYNCPLVYGDLASLSNTTTQKSKITNMIILNTSGITGVFKANSLTKYIYLYGTGQSPSEVDATLIALDNVTPMGASGRVISVNNRTSTSDGAVASLKSKNWQVKVNGTTV